MTHRRSLNFLPTFAALCAVIGSLLVSVAAADTIHFNDGSPPQEGEVVEENDQIIRLRTADGATVTYLKADIERIEKSGPPQPPFDDERFVREIRRLPPGQQLARFADERPPASDRVNRAFDRMFNELDRNLRRKLGERKLREAAPEISAASARLGAVAANYMDGSELSEAQNRFRELERRRDQVASEVDADFAEWRVRANELTRRASNLSSPDDHNEFGKDVAKLRADLVELREALVDDNDISRGNTILSELNAAGIGGDAVPVVPDSGNSDSTIPPPPNLTGFTDDGGANDDAPPAPPTTAAPRIPFDQQNQDFSWEREWQKVLDGEYTLWIIIIVSVPIVGWWIPRYLIKIMIQRMHPRAASWYVSVKRFGIFAFTCFLLNEVKLYFFPGKDGKRIPKGKKKKSKIRCAKCKNPLDVIQMYEDLIFDQCPTCDARIKPLFTAEEYLEHLGGEVEKTVLNRKSSSNLRQVIEKDAMKRLVATIYNVVMLRRGTDLHIDLEMDQLIIRYRVDGVIREMAHMPRTIGPSLVSAIKIQSNLDITEKRIPQDGRFSIEYEDRSIDLRINTSPGSFGDNVSIRFLDRRGIMVTPRELGFEGENYKNFSRAINKPSGLILVTGPTGSGKSTTLYVALREINTGERNIITIEDPIEYRLKGLKQMQVNKAQKFTFATGLRSIMRQDPDVIMVGEVRDKETADIAIDAALTGHLVFTTLHTIDAPRAIARLQDLCVDARRYAAALTMVLAQRLIRVICEECKEEWPASPEELDLLEYKPEEGQKFYRGRGCEHCEESGYFGRRGIHEMLVPNQEFQEMLECKEHSLHQIAKVARSAGMSTLREAGIQRVERGETTLSEVIRVTS